MPSDNIAGVLFTYNRPEYLERVLESIEQNSEAYDIDWYFFQDGPKDKSVNQCISILKKSSLNYTLYAREKNYNIPWQVYYAYSLFNHYDALMFFEDDMIISPYYIKILMKLYKQFPEAIISSADKGYNNPKEIEENLNKVNNHKPHLWGYMAPSSYALAIRDELLNFCNYCGSGPVKGQQMYVKQRWGLYTAAVDCFIETKFDELGLKTITTVIPRGKYIGEKGLHFNPKTFRDKHGFGHDNQYIFEEDKYIEQFELMPS